MSNYLHVCAGPYQLLLDADGIHEILDLDANDGTEAAGYRDWRGQALGTVNGRTLLGMTDDRLPPRRAGVVYSVDVSGMPLMMEFDRVVRLCHVGEASLKPLPPVPARAFRLFDGVLSDEGGAVQLYHLRRPLDAAALLEQPAEKENDVMPELSIEASMDAPPPKKRSTRRKRKG